MSNVRRPLELLLFLLALFATVIVCLRKMGWRPGPVVLLLPATLVGSILTPVLFVNHGVGFFPLLLVVFTDREVGAVSYLIFIVISLVAYIWLLRRMEEPKRPEEPEVWSLSPTGAYAVHVHPWVAPGENVVNTPEIADTNFQYPILHFSDDLWSLRSVEWRSPAVVSLKIRKYPGDHFPSEVEVVVNCAEKVAQVNGESPQPLSKVAASLEKFYVAHRIRVA